MLGPALRGLQRLRGAGEDHTHSRHNEAGGGEPQELQDLQGSPPAIPASGMPTSRMEALVDGVFAIVVTLLIFDIKLPDAFRADGNVSDSSLWGYLLPLLPKIGVYALTFVTLGVLWVGHHNQFVYIKRTDRNLLWIDIFFLAFIAFIPFTAQLLSGAYRNSYAVAIYGLNLTIGGLCLYWQWWYATKPSHGLIDAKIDKHLDSVVVRRILTPPVLYIAGIAIAFAGYPFTILSIAIYIFVPVSYILPSHIDLHWRGARA